MYMPEGFSFSPPAAATSASFLDQLKQTVGDAAFTVIRAKAAAEAERALRGSTANVTATVADETEPKASDNGLLGGRLANLSDLQLAGLVSAGVLSLALVIRLIAR